MSKVSTKNVWEKKNKEIDEERKKRDILILIFYLKIVRLQKKNIFLHFFKRKDKIKVEMLKNNLKLTYLQPKKKTGCQIGVEGTKKLAQLLKSNNSIQTLNLQCK